MSWLKTLHETLVNSPSSKGLCFKETLWNNIIAPATLSQQATKRPRPDKSKYCINSRMLRYCTNAISMGYHPGTSRSFYMAHQCCRPGTDFQKTLALRWFHMQLYEPLKALDIERYHSPPHGMSSVRFTHHFKTKPKASWGNPAKQARKEHTNSQMIKEMNTQIQIFVCKYNIA